METQILLTDRAYTPDRWVDAQEAYNLVQRGVVDYSFGETALVLRGGINRITQERSVIELGSILVINTGSYKSNSYGHVPLTSSLLFKRDRHICAYCNEGFKKSDLTMDHVTPQAAGGPTTWENLVTACFCCNQKKRDRTPAQAKMELIYVPYKPNKFEYLILSGRNILVDQMDFLMSKVPKTSRLHLI